MIPSHSSNLLDDLEHARSSGFTEDFLFKEGRLYARGSRKYYSSKECRIVGTWRYEGISDPDDSAILFRIECNDGTKGVITSAYGVYADTALIDFLTSLG